MMSQTEVTQLQYKTAMGENPSYYRNRPDWKVLPVETVNWYDAVAYCNKISALEGLEACYKVRGEEVKWPKGLECRGYRLPTEAEWEYAAKANTPNYFAGSDSLDEVAWHQGNANWRTHPVRTKMSNSWALYDMTGNVWEWVWDISLYSGELPKENRTWNTRTKYRGGSYRFSYEYIAVTDESSSPTNERFDDKGIRIVRSLP